MCSKIKEYFRAIIKENVFEDFEDILLKIDVEIIRIIWKIYVILEVFRYKNS